ncbi:MAG: class II poly(R)-hydroxyalkanoic acid synthase, partial [Pseudomonas sp.]
MRDKSVPTPVTPPADKMNVQNAVMGLRGRDVLSTVRTLALQGLRRPVYSAKHALALGGQLGRVLIGDTLHKTNPNDARFADPTWQLNPFYKRSLQAYLAWQQQLHRWIEESDLPADDRTRARFIATLLGDALAPSNSVLNPLAIKELLNSGGTSIFKGMRHLYDDLLHNSGMPRQVNKKAFEVGRNLATTPGSVVFRNEMLELIQYKPMSEKQYAKPLVIVPPQINKFYIFDLSPEKSFVQYCLKNGLQVFMVSWRNPDARHREWGLSSYVQALEAATDVARAITGSKEVNLIGACAGGLTIAALQGHLQAKRQLRKVSSATYMVSLLDSQIESPAMLFADEKTLEAAKRRSYQNGVLDG